MNFKLGLIKEIVKVEYDKDGQPKKMYVKYKPQDMSKRVVN